MIHCTRNVYLTAQEFFQSRMAFCGGSNNCQGHVVLAFQAVGLVLPQKNLESTLNVLRFPQ